MTSRLLMYRTFAVWIVVSVSFVCVDAENVVEWEYAESEETYDHDDDKDSIIWTASSEEGRQVVEADRSVYESTSMEESGRHDTYGDSTHSTVTSTVETVHSVTTVHRSTDEKNGMHDDDALSLQHDNEVGLAHAAHAAAHASAHAAAHASAHAAAHASAHADAHAKAVAMAWRALNFRERSCAMNTCIPSR